MAKRCIVLLGLLVCLGTAGAEPLVEGDVEAGKTRAAACAACHGPQGNKQSAQFPKLAGQGAPYIYAQLKLFKSGKRENAIMAGQAAGLSDQDMKNVAVYFAAQQTQPGVANKTIAPAGAALYHGGKPDKNVPACAGCHGPSGLGNPAARYPRISGQNPEYIVSQLQAYRDGGRSGYTRATIMNGVAENLTDTDIKALASYVSGLAPAGENTANEHGALMQNTDSKPTSGSGTADQARQSNTAEDAAPPSQDSSGGQSEQTQGTSPDQATDQAAPQSSSQNATSGGGQTTAGQSAGTAEQPAQPAPEKTAPAAAQGSEQPATSQPDSDQAQVSGTESKSAGGNAGPTPGDQAQATERDTPQSPASPGENESSQPGPQTNNQAQSGQAQSGQTRPDQSPSAASQASQATPDGDTPGAADTRAAQPGASGGTGSSQADQQATKARPDSATTAAPGRDTAPAKPNESATGDTAADQSTR